MSWGYKNSPPITSLRAGRGVYFIFNILLRRGIGYNINTDAVGVYNGKMAVAPRFFA